VSRTWSSAVGLLVLGLLAGCAAGDDVGAAAPTTSAASSGPTTTSTTSTTPAPATGTTSSAPSESASSRRGPGAVVTTSGSDYGTVLVDDRRQAIYLFDIEAGRTPRCYGACAAAWPPVLTTGEPRARRQVSGDLLGTVRRRDGSRQVTYAGHPLYFYAHEGPGQLLCHDIVEYGGRWLAVTPRGVAAPA
jgi:predicted lipoprotein with Yx(FWY)xxD motif